MPGVIDHYGKRTFAFRRQVKVGCYVIAGEAIVDELLNVEALLRNGANHLGVERIVVIGQAAEHVQQSLANILLPRFSLSTGFDLSHFLASLFQIWLSEAVHLPLESWSLLFGLVLCW